MSGEIKKKLKVLIADPHVLIRQILVSIIREFSDAKSTVSIKWEDAEHLLGEIEKIQPDIMFLGLDGAGDSEISLVHMLREKYPGMPLILMTPLSEKGALVAFQSLKAGAVEFVTKPDKHLGVMLSKYHFRKRVIPLIKLLSEINKDRLVSVLPDDDKGSEVQGSLSLKSQKMASNVDLVVVSGCTGGVESLLKLMKSLPAKLPVPVVIVQHLPKIYTRIFASELDKLTDLNVREAQRNSPLVPGQVYMAPGGYHTVVRKDGNRNVLNIHKGPRENKNRPSIDVFLRSAAQVYKERVLAVFLSGGGNDGIAGAGYISESGGRIVLQNRKNALFWSLSREIHDAIPGVMECPEERLGHMILNQVCRFRFMKSQRTLSGQTGNLDFNTL